LTDTGDALTIAALKVYVRDFLNTHLEPVQPQSATSGRVHLEVWRSPQKRRTVGIEMGHDGMVNLWLKALNVPRDLPTTIAVAKKSWTGRGWTDEARKGANSNLFGFEDFHTHKISRLTVTSIPEARHVLEALLP
jgi:hypothetical protein